MDSFLVFNAGNTIAAHSYKEFYQQPVDQIAVESIPHPHHEKVVWLLWTADLFQT